MSAGAVAVLLSCLSCCGSAVWRYHASSPNYRIFSTRSTITLEYEGTLFSEWSVPGTCSLKNKRSPKTELRCSSPGIQTIRPIVTGPDLEEERYLFVGSSNTCFMWYHRVISFHQNLTQIIKIWVYDPENADPNELLWNAVVPSLNSFVLTKLFATLGQKPAIHTFLKRRIYYADEKLEDGAWHISLPMSGKDIIKEIRGNQVTFQDCFVADILFLLGFPWFTIPEVPGFLPITSPLGSQLMIVWDTCAPSSIVLVADMETFQTNDSFRTWTSIRVPPNILTDEERSNVSDVNLSRDGIFFLINGILYLKSSTRFAKLGRKENLPEGEIIGIKSRRWCWHSYLSKANKRSNMAIWTKNELYLGYPYLKFVKIIDTKRLGEILHILPTATLSIHNIEYTAHPLELGLLLNVCVTCNVMKKIHLVIYNEDSEQWAHKDFSLNVTIDSVVTPYFLYSSIPELIVWDKHRIYYFYDNFTTTGVLQTPTEFGNLSKLSHDSIIHSIFIDYYGNILVKMENNILFYSKINIRDAVKLHLWTDTLTKSAFFWNSFNEINFVNVLGNGTLYVQEYPIGMEVRSITFKTKEKCPFVTFHNNIRIFYLLDKGESLSVWAQIVYPENNGLYIIMEPYGPKLLEMKYKVQYEIASGFCTKTLFITFFQNVNYQAVDDYFKLQYQNTGLMLMQLRPSEYTKTCPVPPKVFQISVGCDPTKFIVVKGFGYEGCRQHDFFYSIGKSFLRNRPSGDLRVKYSWRKYGCPLRLNFNEKFHPLLQLYNENGFIKDVDANFIVWEIHGRDDYTYNLTMQKSGCLNEAQTWNSMITRNKNLSLEEVWGPENYKHCFSYGIGKPGDLSQPYEIINKSNHNHLVWPLQHAGMYVFRVKILDPNYSFCNLTALFAIQISGVIPSPNGYLVFSILFLLMLLFCSILTFSYFHYMMIYKPDNRKQKDN
ncbi:cation channel sperm-associated auxiliary subunit epsilon-like [Myotis daubentonii]|uniref:cation channel sperm-associated auxiliary subunit epsilon-like n=1 Tax=Myotis daubentonii TaxID=98922 RepID=UPI002873D5C7|nr:cation channel sperm-associated auxiliary subunit epsilon-like [Myotis daubentonii]